MGALIRSYKFKVFMVVISGIILEIAAVTFFMLKDRLLLFPVVLMVLLCAFILVILLDLKYITLGYLLFVPIIIYILENQFVAVQNLGSRLIYVENAFLALLFIMNVFLLKRKKEIKGILPETVIIIMLCIGNLITYFQFQYEFKVYLLSTNFYLRYFVISLIIYFSKIDYEVFIKILKLFSIFIISNTVICILQFIFGDPFLSPFVGGYFYSFRNDLIRCIGVFPWPTELGAFSGLFFIIYYFSGKHLKYNFFYLISFFCILNILLSQSRLALLLVIIILFIDNIKKILKLMRYSLILVLIYVFINFGMGININEYIINSIEEYSMPEKAPRIYYVIHGIDIFRDHPFFGIGFDRYGTQWINELENYHLFNKYGIKQFERLSTTDSFIAKILPEFGVFGTILLIVFYIILLMKSIRIMKIDQRYKTFFYLLVYYIFYLFNSAHVLFNLNMGPVFWIIAGLVIKYYSVLYKKNIFRIPMESEEVSEKVK